MDDLISQTGAVPVGNRTFRGDDPYKGQEGEGEAGVLDEAVVSVVPMLLGDGTRQPSALSPMPK